MRLFSSYFSHVKRQRGLEEFRDPSGRGALVARAGAHFFPESDGIAKFIERQQAQPAVMLGKNERPAAPGQGIAIALLDDARGFLAGEGEVLFLDGQIGAGKEANQIHGIGGGPGFIEIIDAPDEPAFEVAPGAEIFDVQIADGEDLGCARRVRGRRSGHHSAQR